MKFYKSDYGWKDSPRSIDLVRENMDNYVVVGHEWCSKMYNKRQINFNETMSRYVGKTAAEVANSDGKYWNWGEQHFVHKSTYLGSPIKRIKIRGM